MERKPECEEPCLPPSERPPEGATVYSPSPARTPTAPLLSGSEPVYPSYRYANDTTTQGPMNAPHYPQCLPDAPYGHASGRVPPFAGWNPPPPEGAHDFNSPQQQHVRQPDGYPSDGAAYHAEGYPPDDCHVDLSVPDVPPPSYGFVTESGMEQFQKGLPPVDPNQPQVCHIGYKKALTILYVFKRLQSI